MNRVTRKFNYLIGGSVLGEHKLTRENTTEASEMITTENPVELYFRNERRIMRGQVCQIAEYVRKPGAAILYPSVIDARTSPLPRVYNLNLDGAWPYFFLVVGFLWAVGGWLVWCLWLYLN